MNDFYFDSAAAPGMEGDDDRAAIQEIRRLNELILKKERERMTEQDAQAFYDEALHQEKHRYLRNLDEERAKHAKTLAATRRATEIEISRLTQDIHSWRASADRQSRDLYRSNRSLRIWRYITAGSWAGFIAGWASVYFLA